MGECHCSKIAIMQLFHELKQQFPALPDHVVSQCIAQNSHDKETCARSLRATQESRPPPGAFPPPPPQSEFPPALNEYSVTNLAMNQDESRLAGQSEQPLQSLARKPTMANQRAHRPVSLDISMDGTTSRDYVAAQSNQQQQQQQQQQHQIDFEAHPSSAPAVFTTRGFFEDVENATGVQGNSSFELSVNVACSPSGSQDYLDTSDETFALQQQDYQPALMLAEPATTRSFTSVSLTLRPPSSDPQPPIDISSQGSSLTYSSSSLDPRGFQSLLQISIGRGGAAGAAAARIKPPPAPQRPTSLVNLATGTTSNRPPGLPIGPANQVPRPTSTVSAPTTPSGPVQSVATPSSSLPTTPLTAPTTSLGAIPRTPKVNVPQSEPEYESQSEIPEEFREILDQVEDQYKSTVLEQLIRKSRMTKALEAEMAKLEDLKKEIEILSQPEKLNKSPKEIERQLRSEIYQLQLECDRLTEEVDQYSDSQVPLGETNEAFYQSIYTGQQFAPPSLNVTPPPIPSQPSVWEPEPSGSDNQEETDGPSWICQTCTFKNHPLMNNCEQCDMPKVVEESAQGTRIRNSEQRFLLNEPNFPSTSR